MFFFAECLTQHIKWSVLQFKNKRTGEDNPSVVPRKKPEAEPLQFIVKTENGKLSMVSLSMKVNFKDTNIIYTYTLCGIWCAVIQNSFIKGILGALLQKVHLTFVQIKFGHNVQVVEFKLAEIRYRNEQKLTNVWYIGLHAGRLPMSQGCYKKWVC